MAPRGGEEFWRDDHVRYSGFVFEAEEHEAFRSFRLLAADDQAGDADEALAGGGVEIGRAEDAHFVQALHRREQRRA